MTEPRYDYGREDALEHVFDPPQRMTVRAPAEQLIPLGKDWTNPEDMHPAPDTLVVGIGRNSYTDRDSGTALPLGETEWEGFKGKVLDLLDSAGGTVFFAGEGTGWSERWGEEDAYTVVASVVVTDYLRRSFAVLAVAFGQDAIALTVGTTSFVGRDGWTS